jgi:acid phosphatase family membrane protein YuiD
MLFGNELIKLLATTWMVSQTIKYLIKLYAIKVFSLGHLRKTYLYASGLPSGHAAVLTASFLFMLHKLGPQDPMIFILFVFGYFWLFEIYMQRKRYDAQIELLDSLQLKELRHEEVKLYKDLNGHDLVDLAGGIFVAVVVYLIFIYFHWI